MSISHLLATFLTPILSFISSQLGYLYPYYDVPGDLPTTTISHKEVFSIDPIPQVVAPNTYVKLTIHGGIPPFTYHVEGEGTLHTLKIGGEDIYYKTPNKEGESSITIEDGNKEKVSVSIITSTPLVLRKNVISLSFGEPYVISPSGGVGPYTFSLVRGKGKLSSQGIFVAPTTQGTTYIRVRDSIGQELVAEIITVTSKLVSSQDSRINTTSSTSPLYSLPYSSLLPTSTYSENPVSIPEQTQAPSPVVYLEAPPVSPPQPVAPIPPVESPTPPSICTRNSLMPAKNIFGINLGGFREDHINQQKGLGITWLRMDVRFDLIEPQEGNYYWDGYDNEVRLAIQNGITLTFTISYTPTWAKNKNDVGYTHALDTFTRALVARYKPGGIFAQQEGWPAGYGVSYWEIFNEPNLPGYGWGDIGVSPEVLLPRYIDSLTIMNAAIRSQDNNAFIILGGLSPDGMSPATFWDTLYTQGVSQCFDIIAFHPYGYEDGLAEGYQTLAQYLVNKSDPHIPIWFNELGTNNEANQESLIRKMVAARSGVDSLFFFSLIDYDESGGKFGLVGSNGVKKPNYTLLKTLLQGNP